MNELFISVRWINGAWHVVARGDDLERTHKRGFARSEEAFGLMEEVRAGLDRGLDLHLAFWETAQA